MTQEYEPQELANRGKFVVEELDRYGNRVALWAYNVEATAEHKRALLNAPGLESTGILYRPETEKGN